jgi:hypothetical protein
MSTIYHSTVSLMKAGLVGTWSKVEVHSVV